MRRRAGACAIESALARHHWRTLAQTLARLCMLLGAGVSALLPLGLTGCAGSGAAAPAANAAPGPRVREVTPAPAPDKAALERRARGRLELAAAYFANGQYDAALGDIQQALQLAPALPDGYGLRAMVHAARGDDALAEADFNTALQRDPQHGPTLHNRGWFHCQRGRYALAQQQFLAALATPQYRDVARTQLARGVCLARDSRWDEAEQALMKAYEYDPANPATGFSLAELLYRRGAFERARFYVGRVNGLADTANAQSLWLALRIERKLGDAQREKLLAQQLRDRFPQSPELGLYEGGRFDD